MRWKAVVVECMLIGAVAALNPEPAEAQKKVQLTREVDAPGREPYNTTIFITVPDLSNGVDGLGETIPADKRLVIEFVSFRVTLPAGQVPLVEVSDLVGGESANYFFPLTLLERQSVSSGNFDEYRGAYQVRLYVDAKDEDGNGAATNTRATCARFLKGGTANCHVSISGYLMER